MPDPRRVAAALEAQGTVPGDAVSAKDVGPTRDRAGDERSWQLGSLGGAAGSPSHSLLGLNVEGLACAEQWTVLARRVCARKLTKRWRTTWDDRLEKRSMSRMMTGARVDASCCPAREEVERHRDGGVPGGASCCPGLSGGRTSCDLFVELRCRLKLRRWRGPKSKATTLQHYGVEGTLQWSACGRGTRSCRMLPRLERRPNASRPVRGASCR